MPLSSFGGRRFSSGQQRWPWKRAPTFDERVRDVEDQSQVEVVRGVNWSAIGPWIVPVVVGALIVVGLLYVFVWDVRHGHSPHHGLIYAR